MSQKYIEQALVTLSNQFHGNLVTMTHFEDALIDAINALQKLDQIKKALFYGREDNEFIQAMKESVMMKANGAPNFSFNRTHGETTIHGILGVATEAGELLESLYNSVASGVEFDSVNLKEEFGDVLWYMAILAKFNGFSFEDAMNKNIEKLQKKRYKNGFNSQDAIQRDLVAERAALENDLPDHLFERLNTCDASIWAKEFMKILHQKGWGIVDEGFMIGWFANAIETAKDKEV